MKLNHRSASSLHLDLIRRNSHHLSSLKSTRLCLYCLQNMPEHILECGHTLCDTCVSIIGEPISGEEYRYKIGNCHFCLARSHCQAKLMPPTCGARLISIDGGGSRGIIPLAFLDALQDVLGLPYPIQEHCDFGIGTSSGMKVSTPPTRTNNYSSRRVDNPCFIRKVLEDGQMHRLF